MHAKPMDTYAKEKSSTKKERAEKKEETKGKEKQNTCLSSPREWFANYFFSFDLS